MQLTKEEQKSLHMVIAYLFEREQKDWLANGVPNNHIFNDVRRLDDALEANAKNNEQE